MLMKLERLSGLRFQSIEEIHNLQEDIRLANKIFEVDTKGVEPMYSIVEEIVNCPLRDDVAEATPKDKSLMNAKMVYEDFFVSPPPNIPLEPNPLFDEWEKLNKEKSWCRFKV